MLRWQFGTAEYRGHSVAHISQHGGVWVALDSSGVLYKDAKNWKRIDGPGTIPELVEKAKQWAESNFDPSHLDAVVETERRERQARRKERSQKVEDSNV